MDTMCFKLRGEGTEALELDIYDVVGDSWWEDSVSAKSVRALLRANAQAQTIKVRINSEGGDVIDGFAIYNLLHEHQARVLGRVDGIAASIASVILMACDEIEIAKNAFVMIHNPWGGMRGESDDMRRFADVLDKMRDQAADVYAARTGMDRAAVLQMMKDETWLTADEALAKGFVDKVVPLKRGAASATSQAFAQMSLRGFDNVPSALREAVATARAQGRQQILPVEPDTSREAQETDMVNKALLAQLLGIAAASTDETFEAAMTAQLKERGETGPLIAELAKLEAATGKRGNEAVGVALAWKASHDSLATLQVEVATLKASAAKGELDKIIADAKAANKLTPAEEATLRAQVEAGELTLKGAKAMLETKASHAALANAHVKPASGIVVDASTKHNGKTFAEMSGRERAELKRENPELYAAMLKASQD